MSETVVPMRYFDLDGKLELVEGGYPKSRVWSFAPMGENSLPRNILHPINPDNDTVEEMLQKGNILPETVDAIKQMAQVAFPNSSLTFEKPFDEQTCEKDPKALPSGRYRRVTESSFSTPSGNQINLHRIEFYNDDHQQTNCSIGLYLNDGGPSLDIIWENNDREDKYMTVSIRNPEDKRESGETLSFSGEPALKLLEYAKFCPVSSN